MVNVYLDMPLNDNVGLFTRAGCGMARITQEIETRVVFNGISLNKEEIESKTYNFAYNFTVGGSYKITPSSRLDIAYIWKNFGYSKAGKFADGDSTSKIYYNSSFDKILSITQNRLI